MSTAAVVILNYNDHAATLACVDSVADDDTVGDIIVVDNGSRPGDIAALRAALGGRVGVRLVDNGSNAGFGAGMNVGIAAALATGADGILLLNNDTVVGPGAVGLLLDALARDARVGVAVPVVTTGAERDRIWAAGGSLDPRSLRLRHHLAGASACTTVTDQRLTFAPGAALMLRPSTLREAGGFAEGFFLYWEDVELSLRIARLGWRIELVAAARVWHAVQGGNQQRTLNSLYYRTRNAVWLARQVAGWQGWLVGLLCVLRGIRVAAQRTRGNRAAFPSGVRHVARGARDGFGRVPDLTPRRF